VARPAPKAISEQDLQAAVSELTDFYTTQDTAIQHGRDVVEFTNTIPLDDAYKTTGYVVRDATATDHVLSTGMMLTVNRPKLQLTYEGGGDKKEKLVAKLEPALTALVLDDAGHRSETYKRVGMSLVQDGGAWSMPLFVPDVWTERWRIKRKGFADDAGYPAAKGSQSAEEKFLTATDKAKRRAAKSVLDWRYLDPKTVYPVFLGEHDLGAVLIVTEHPRWRTLAENGLALDRDGNIVDQVIGQGQPETGPRRAGETIRKIEHWTAKSCSVFLVAGKSTRRIESWDHGYGFLPVVWTLGWRLPHWSNVKVGWGAAGVMLGSVEYLSYLKTLHANQAAGSVAPAYQRTVPLGGDVVRDNLGKPVPYTELRPNAVLNLNPGETIEPIQSAQVNQHIREQIAMEQQQLSDLRGPVASGNLNDAQNGFAIESVKSDRKVKHAAFIEGLDDHLSQVTEMIIRLIRDKIKETVWVRPRADKAAGWMSISPSDLEDEPLITWDISPEQPSGAIVEGRYYHERLQAGTIGPSMAIERMGDNPSDVNEDILEGLMRKDPLYVQLAQQELVSELGRGDLLARYQQLKQQFATGQVPPSGGPSVGGSMGAGGSPGDTAALTMSPNGAGAMPIPNNQAGIPTGGGFSPQGATAQIQNLGG
jgi:hypothetical protein